MKAIVYRYNAKNRKDRQFNNCSSEKNPNMVKFYALDLEYASKYDSIWTKEGYHVYDCKLEVAEVEGNFFNMVENFASLSTYRSFINEKVEEMRRGYTDSRNSSKTKKDKAMFQGFLDNLVNEEDNLARYLHSSEFQALSDFARQNELITELTEMGFDGYYTNNEIAVF